MLKISSSVSIITIVSLLLGVQSEIVPTSMFISCGNAITSSNRTGMTWMNDTNFVPDDFSTIGVLIAAPTSPPLKLWEKLLGIKPKKTKPNAKPYDAYRKGRTIKYTIPVAQTPTRYNVTLYFYEPTTAKVGDRVMTINVENDAALMDFDIVAETTAIKKQFVTKTFTVTVSDGKLNIQLSSAKEAVISGISIQAYSAIRIRAGITDYVDTHGNKWTTDAAYTNLDGGNLWGPGYPYPSIDRTRDDPLYLMERNDNFKYYFQGLNNGNHTVRLHFAELYFNKADARVFNVLMQDKEVFGDVDIFKLADNAQNRAVILSATVAVTNGLLVVEFEPVKNYPKISALEII